MARSSELDRSTPLTAVRRATCHPPAPPPEDGAGARAAFAPRGPAGVSATVRPGEGMLVLERLRSGMRRDCADERAFAAVYAEMRRIAERLMRRQPAEHTLQATALVHEAYVRLHEHDVEVEGVPQFRALVARTFRSVLVDHARRKGRRKRNAGGARVPLEELIEALSERARDPAALDDALRRLEAVDPLGVRLVELRFFEGRSMPEVARLLGVPLRTLERDWATVKAWLFRELAP